VPERIGTANRMAAPYQAVEASDGYFVFGANNDRLYQRLCEVIGRPDLLDNPDYATNALRMANREALIGELEKSFVQWTRAECVDMLLAVGIPAGPINDYAEALENDHARERDVVMKIDHPIEGEVNSIGFPVRLSGTPQQVRRPPPLLGEHTAEILAELGIKPAAAQ
jgi:formyl-CoA transferase